MNLAPFSLVVVHLLVGLRWCKLLQLRSSSPIRPVVVMVPKALVFGTLVSSNVDSFFLPYATRDFLEYSIAS